jgi:hypothetical protein
MRGGEAEMRWYEDEAPLQLVYLYDPVTGRAGQVVPLDGAYVAQVDGKAITLTDPERAIEAAWLMLEKRISILPPVPVRKGGAA